ncbi:hypothetical protein CPB84DRAFT_1766837 [Gymnopilus junonius]|uniref:DUF6533 domain-containing protein n=1 Tax=Gymnopilus junonius TaxID=109634 RepID=A0A9P5NTD6_GYMJU|nr:hypothetical protein CPB84DRAFT_1766837 [Gymnopilus junonius]
MAEDVTLNDLAGFAVNYYINLAAFTLLVYDYFLTFVPEVERFWCSGRLNWATGFFYFNRYASLLGHAPVMMEFFWSTANPAKISICHSLQSYHQYLAIVIQLVVACIMIMRIYALYECSVKVLALQIIVAALAVAVGCWAVLGGKKETFPDVLIPTGCASSLTRYQATRLGAAWGGLLFFDTLVFGMTLYKAFSFPHAKEITLLTVLLRDGAVFFCIMVAANLGNMLTFMFGTPYTRGVATTLTNVLSSVMISRLMLNLRHPALVSHGTSRSMAPTEELTYPNITFFGPSYQTDSSGTDATPTSLSESEPTRPGRTRMMYTYLAGGSNRNNHDIDSIELLDRNGHLV